MYILPFIIIALCKYTYIAVDYGTEIPDSISHTAEDDEDNKGKLVMSSFLNKQGIRIRTYASRVKNPKGHMILIHGVRAHFRGHFCRYNLEWYAKNVTEYVRSDAKTVLDKELNDIFPDLKSLKGLRVRHNDSLNGINAFDVTPRFLYEGSFVHALNKFGLSVYGLDLQSHGLSGGINKQRCYFRKFDDFVYDVMQFVSIVKRGRFDDPTEVWDEQLVYSNDRHDNLQYHLIGLSLGGNIVLKSQLLFDLNTNRQGKFIDSIICMNSTLNIDRIVTRCNRLLLPFIWLYSIVAPRRGLLFESMDVYAHGIELCMRYNDPLHHVSRIPSRTLVLIYNAIYDLRNNMHNYPQDLPTLFIHSKYDRICTLEGPRYYINTYFKDSNVVKLHELDGKSHIITNPSDFPIMEPVLKEWFNTLYQ